LSWQFLAALVRYVCGGNACRQQVGAAQDVAFSSCPEALQIYTPVLDVDGFILNAAAGVDKVPHRHLPLYGVAHQARHKVMHLLGATKQRDKMKRPKPVAPVFDLERLLRTCLKEDRSRVARDNLDLVAYWAPSDKSCRPKCRPVWKSTSASGASPLIHFLTMTRPSWLGRAARNRHRHAIEQASRRWRGGTRDDSARTRRKILISTQVPPVQ
jgi:hypothetical protein